MTESCLVHIITPSYLSLYVLRFYCIYWKQLSGYSVCHGPNPGWIWTPVRLVLLKYRHFLLFEQQIHKVYSSFRFPDFNNWKSGNKKISPRIRSIFKNKNRDHLLKFNGLHSGRGYIEPRHYYRWNYSRSRLVWSLWARPKVITLTEW